MTSQLHLGRPDGPRVPASPMRCAKPIRASGTFTQRVCLPVALVTDRGFGLGPFLFCHLLRQASKQSRNDGVKSLQVDVPPLVDHFNHEGNPRCRMNFPRSMT